MNQEEKEIDFSSIIDKIDSIEIPEMEKIDLSPVTKKIDSFSKDINEIKKMVKYFFELNWKIILLLFCNKSLFCFKAFRLLSWALCAK